MDGERAHTAAGRMSHTSAGDGAARLLALTGGRRGLVDGALPTLVFVVTNTTAGGHTSPGNALALAVAAAALAAVGTACVRLLRRDSLRQSAAGAAGLAVAAAFAAISGDTRDFLPPGTVVDGVYATGAADCSGTGVRVRGVEQHDSVVSAEPRS